jgi:iron complex transport system substrate-binding protein
LRPRIVSLLPSATEIICALGFRKELVGRSHECDFPDGVEELPVCTAPKVNGEDTRAIHSSVSQVLQNDISVYRVDADLLRELQPTHIVTQIQCEVCAVSLRDVEAAVAGWASGRPRLVALNPQSLDDIFDDIRRTANALESATAGEALIATMKARLKEIASRAARCNGKPRVATIEWMEPLMPAGNWLPALVGMAGGVNLLGEGGKHSSWITWSALVEADPDVIIIFPCGFRIADIKRDWHVLTSHPLWHSFRAVRDHRVHVCDGNQYFNRPGPRVVETLEILAEILHPDRFQFGHEGIAWERI